MPPRSPLHLQHLWINVAFCTYASTYIVLNFHASSCKRKNVFPNQLNGLLKDGYVGETLIDYITYHAAERESRANAAT
jgi:hypothetical protein